MSELRPFKIVGQLVGAHFDEEGRVIGEEIMGNVTIYEPNFAEVKKMVENAVEVAEREEK